MFDIIRGRVKKPFNVIVYGHQGSGKTTWAMNAPSPLFICGDEVDEIDVPRFPRVTSFEDVIKQLDQLINNEKDYKDIETIVIDSIDVVESLIHQEILSSEKTSKTKSMAKASGGYGAAFDTALRMMTDVKDRLATLRDKHNKNIIIICHSVGKTVSDPILGDTYMEYSLTVHEKVRNLFTSWVSAILFISIEMTKDDNDKFAFSTGDRIMYTQKIAGLHDVKNRYNLNPTLPVPQEDPFTPFYDGYKSYFKRSNVDEVKRLYVSIKELIPNINNDKMVEKVGESLEKNKTNYENLVKLKSKVENLIGIN